MKKIITISREFGSGGHDIGMEVAKRLDIPFYDHEIVDKAVAESGFTKEFVEEHGEYSSLSSVCSNGILLSDFALYTLLGYLDYIPI